MWSSAKSSLAHVVFLAVTDRYHIMSLTETRCGHGINRYLHNGLYNGLFGWFSPTWDFNIVSVLYPVSNRWVCNILSVPYSVGNRWAKKGPTDLDPYLKSLSGVRAQLRLGKKYRYMV